MCGDFLSSLLKVLVWDSALWSYINTFFWACMAYWASKDEHGLLKTLTVNKRMLTDVAISLKAPMSFLEMLRKKSDFLNQKNWISNTLPVL